MEREVSSMGYPPSATQREVSSTGDPYITGPEAEATAVCVVRVLHHYAPAAEAACDFELGCL